MRDVDGVAYVDRGSYGNPKTRARVAAVRVNRGARWLDENFPGWEKRIDMNTLALDDSEMCICGQVFAADADPDALEWTEYDGFEYAIRNLFTEANGWITRIAGKVDPNAPQDVRNSRAEHVAIALGFSHGDHGRMFITFEDLQAAWSALLEKRLLVNETV